MLRALRRRLHLLAKIGPWVVAAQTCPSDVTSSDALGPFYLAGAPLTDRLAPEEQLSDPNLRLVVQGTVYGQDCVPMANVLVEPWYAGLPDENGDSYSSSGSSLNYRAQVVADECGRFNFTATFPESYSARPIRHIHYRVSHSEGTLLVTQQYFEGSILDGFNPDESQITPLVTDEDGARITTFDIYVSGAGTADAVACGLTGTEPAPTPALDPVTSSATLCHFKVVACLIQAVAGYVSFYL